MTRNLKSEVKVLLAAAVASAGEHLSPPPNEEQIRDLGQRMGFGLLSELQEWLLISGLNRVGTKLLLSVSPNPGLDIAHVLNRRPAWRAKQWIPIAADWFGD